MDAYFDNDHVQEVCSAVLHHRRQAGDQEGPTTHRERGRLPPPVASFFGQIRRFRSSPTFPDISWNRLYLVHDLTRVLGAGTAGIFAKLADADVCPCAHRRPLLRPPRLLHVHVLPEPLLFACSAAVSRLTSPLLSRPLLNLVLVAPLAPDLCPPWQRANARTRAPAPPLHACTHPPASPAAPHCPCTLELPSPRMNHQQLRCRSFRR